MTWSVLNFYTSSLTHVVISAFVLSHGCAKSRFELWSICIMRGLYYLIRISISSKGLRQLTQAQMLTTETQVWSGLQLNHIRSFSSLYIVLCTYCLIKGVRPFI